MALIRMTIGTPRRRPEPHVVHTVGRETGLMTGRTGNRLASQTSPYLLQHAEDPVGWFPWGEEAFAEARANDKPVFLSVGYAACHWCHVMHRESFSDRETADLLNARFVPVKVDREERPDVDAVYMDAVQAMTGAGGWPMSVWLTPDGRPFYAGTYFPEQPQHGMPSFRQVLEAVAEGWATRREEVEEQGQRLVETIAASTRLAPTDTLLDERILRAARMQLSQRFDETWGGFGGAPKFPEPMVLEFLLRLGVRGEHDASEMATTTIDRMSAGGIHDQVGGGFSRYATDQRWHVPHFEKMLYDNTQLALVCVHAWLFTRADRYRHLAERTFDYLLREMRHGAGGFFASQDADSEGIEGTYYVWGWDELVALIGGEAATALGATREGNWEGHNVLWRPPDGQKVDPRTVDDAVRVLFAARQHRVRPATDDKIVTAWNASAIRALAEAGRAFRDVRYTAAALSCATFVWEEMRRPNGSLVRTWRDGRKGPPGYADDHAGTASAFLSLYETTGDPTWLERAQTLCEIVLERFADPAHGGFYQTADDAETLVVRPKDLIDGAVPSGNSLAAEALLRLALFTGDAASERAAESALRLVSASMRRAPNGFGHALCALDLRVGPSREVAIVGDPDAPDTMTLLDEAVRSTWRPNIVLAVGDPGGESGRRVPLLTGRTMVDSKATAYVCERFRCRQPVTDVNELRAQLS
jgi:uncharacterized protein YyaL (SSP411 family)